MLCVVSSAPLSLFSAFSGGFSAFSLAFGGSTVAVVCPCSFCAFSPDLGGVSLAVSTPSLPSSCFSSGLGVCSLFSAFAGLSVVVSAGV